MNTQMKQTDDELAEELARYNEAYRAGSPIITDAEYDLLLERLRDMNPDHPYLQDVEPEPEGVFGTYTVTHGEPMLSTDKAYTEDELAAYFRRCEQAATELGMNPDVLIYRATPKLDGMAGYDDGQVLATRGDGIRGQDITHAFERGAVAAGGRGQGAGELVLSQSYYLEHLKEPFQLKHPRNYVAGFVGADEVKPHHEAAAAAGVIRFVPYNTLEFWQGTRQEFEAQQDDIVARLREVHDYETDGVVLELIDHGLKQYMGATSHHHRWQIALKTLGETADTTIEDITLQTGRTGRVTPVMEIAPVELAGATLRRATAHTGTTVARMGLGIGARIRVTRAGEVIPTLLEVLEPADQVFPVETCPSCGHDLEVDGEYMICPNTAGCDAQTEGTLRHFFATLGNVDLFGPATIERLVAHGYTAIPTIYLLQENDFAAMGFGPGQSANLRRELDRSLVEPVEDWRFLGALGVRHLGRGDSRKLLAQYPLESVTTLSAADIEAVKGFGPVTSPLIAEQLQAMAGTITRLLEMGFTLIRTPVGAASRQDTVIAGKGIVFTGTMTTGSREQMQARARELGANVQSSVTGKTDYLVAGEKVGPKKLEAAKAKGVFVLTEADYLDLIGEA